jgi:uncharacterized membrane protein (DUF4010 family)
VNFLDRPEWRLAVALAIGLVIGAERERRKGRGRNRSAAGIRTFALTAVLGGIAFHLGVAAVVAFALLVGAASLFAYALGDRSDPGLTTELALVLTFALGVLAQTEPLVALAVGLLVTALLAYRSGLHRIVRGILTERELLDFLILSVSALVVLPMLPDRALDPLSAFNPYRIWKLAVVMMALTGAGYVAQRLVGARFGLAIAGMASGFVSASATVSSMAARSRASPALLGPAVAGASASMVATFVQMAILVGTASPVLLRASALPLGAGAAMALLFAALQTLRAGQRGDEREARGRAFNLRLALGFALLVTAVNVAATLAGRWLGQGGVVATTALAGFADVHAPSAAIASLTAGGEVSTQLGLLAMLAAFTANTFTKAILTWQGGSASFRSRVLLGLGLVLGAVWGGFVARQLTA